MTSAASRRRYCAQFGAPKFSTSTIAELVANAEAKAVLEKHMPQVISAADQVEGLQGMAPDRLTDPLLTAIDADLAKIK